MSTDEKLSLQQKLKDLYSRQDKIPPLIEGVEEEDEEHKMPERTMKEYYVKLKTIVKEDGNQQGNQADDEKEHKVTIDMEGLFDKLDISDESKPDPTKVLMVGGAGVGKTTFMRYMAYKWSQGELWADKFDFVFRVSLKTITNPAWYQDYKLRRQNGDLLKCLVHHTVMEGFYELGEEEDIPIEQMEWPESKERVLLLLDGYDDILHLRSEDPRSDFTQLFKKIYAHKYMIISSRPNGIDDRLKKNFDRIVETLGLGHEGIKQYFTKYFEDHPEEGEKLEKFLRTNSAIREICKVPVNMAMLCYSWEQSQHEGENHTISSIAGLYGQVMKHLEKRYFVAHKWKPSSAGSSQTLQDRLNNGNLCVDEMKVLEHIAYKAFTAGGIEVKDPNKKEAIIIPGVFRDAKGNPKNTDEEGIAVQSSINLLAKAGIFTKGVKVSVNDVYKFGVLRVEKRATKEQSGKQENIQSQDFCFIYRTFQEYLLALYFKEKLEGPDSPLKTEFCEYLAENRNQPRYLMALKFLAGIITEDTRATTEKTIKIFWNAMTCNVDGLIELGVETKVTLMMHLLGQAMIDGKLDERIPNKQEMIDLIDAVVLNDLPNWGTQLRESNYMSNNIKEALMKTFEDGNMAWRAEKLKQIQGNSSSTPLKETIRIILEQAEGSKENIKDSKEAITKGRIIDTITDLISVFENHDDQHKVIVKLVENLKDKTLARYAGEGLKKLIPQVSFTTDEMTLLSDKLTPMALEEGSAELALATILEIAIISTDTKLIDQVIPNVLSKKWANKNTQARVLDSVIKMTQIKQNPQTIVLAIGKLVSQGCFEQPLAFDAIKKISEGIEDRSISATIIKEVVKDFTSTNDQNVCLTFLHAINRLVLTITEGVAKKSLENMSDLINNGNEWVKAVMIYAIGNVAETAKDKSLATELLSKIRPFLEHNNVDIKSSATYAMIILTDLTKDAGQAPKLIELGTNQLVDANTKEFIKQGILNKLPKLFGLIKDKELYVKLMDQLATLYSTLSGQKDASKISVKIAETNVLVQIGQASTDRDIKARALAQIADLFCDEDEKVRYSAHRAFGALFAKVGDEDIKDKAIEKITNSLAEGKNKTRFYAGEALFRISKDINKEELVDQLFDKVSEFLASNSWSLRTLAVELVAKFSSQLEDQYKNKKTEAVKKIMALIPASPEITDEEHKFFGTVIFAVSQLIEGIEDEKLLGDILAKSYLHASNFKCEAVLKAVIEKTSQIKNLINKVLYYTADPKARGHDKEVAWKYLDSVQQLAKTDKAVALAYFDQVPELLGMGAIGSDLIFNCIDEILTNIKDNTLINKLFEKATTSLFSKNEEAEKGAVMLLEQLKRPEIQSLLEAKVKSVISSLDTKERETAITSLSKLCNIAEAKLSAAKVFGNATKVLSLFSDQNSEARKCAVKLSVGLLKQNIDEGKVPEIVSGVQNLVKDTNLEVQTTALEALPDLVINVNDEKRVEELVNQALGVLENARKDENFDVRIVAMKTLIRLTESVKDKALINRMVEQILQPLLQKRSFANHDLDATITLVNTCDKLIKNIKNKEEAVKYTQELLNIFTDADDVFNLKQLRSSAKAFIFRQVQKEKISEEKDEDEITKNALNSNTKRVTIRTSVNLVDSSDDKPLLSKLGLAVEYKLAISVLDKTIKLIEDEKKLEEILDLAIQTANFEIAEKIVQALEDKKFATYVFTTSIKELTEGSPLFLASTMSLLGAIASLIDNKDLINQAYQLVKAKFPTLGAQLAAEKHSAGQTMGHLSVASKDQALMIETVNTLVEYLVTGGPKAHSRDEKVEKTIQSTCKAIEDKNFVIQTFEKLLQRGEKKGVRGFIVDDLLSPEDLMKYLESSDTDTKNIMVWVLNDFFNKFLKTFDQIDELLKDYRSLTVDVLVKRLFGNKLGKSAKSEIESGLSDLKADSAANFETFKKSLISNLKRAKQIMDHKIIQIALATIGFEGASAKEKDEKDLMDISKRVLDHQLKQLDDEGLEWINENFDTLTALSSESKPFFKKLYHKLIEDLEITPLEEQIIIKCINQGLTTSISRDSDIIFEGQTYKIINKGTGVFLEEIAKAVIDQQRDTLAPQYKLHMPIFPTSETVGMKQAAIDVETVESAVDSFEVLSNNSYILSQLKNENQTIVMLEQRGSIGDHLIYHMNSTMNKFDLVRIIPTNNQGTYKQDQLEKIFGKYAKGTKLKGKTATITPTQGEEVLNKGSLEVNEFLKDPSGDDVVEIEYFQQELLGLGTSEKLDSIQNELGKKLTDFTLELRAGLQKRKELTAANKHAIKNYFDAFISVFASTFTTSQAISSGKFNLNVSDSKTNAAATVVSFIPFIGAQAAKAVKSVGEFMKTNEIKHGADKMMELAADAVELNQIIGKIACQILLENEAKLQQVIIIKNEHFKSASTAMINKVKKMFPGLSEIGDMVNGYLNEGDKAPSMKLGRNDANKIVEEWVKGSITKDDISKKFIEIALTSFVIEEPKEEDNSGKKEIEEENGSKAPLNQPSNPVSPGEEVGQPTDNPRRCCCTLF